MLRAVVDVNILVSALIRSDGPPAAVLHAWASGAFDLVVSLTLLSEFDTVLARPRIQRRLEPSAAAELRTALEAEAVLVDDPAPERTVARDPKDDYLVALARTSGAHAIVTGDRHLLDLEGLTPPALEARTFLMLVERLPE